MGIPKDFPGSPGRRQTATLRCQKPCCARHRLVLFARRKLAGIDWLFVEEAGQVGLANLAAMGRDARNIVLVGDPRKLPQVIQGAHPELANLSCLGWMLGEHATV